MGRIREAGYGGLLLLTLSLPFDLRYHPLFQHGLFVVTNLGVLVYAVSILALVTLARHDSANYFHRRRVPVLLFVALLLSCTISSLLEGRTDASLLWMLNLLAAGLIWLAVPQWLTNDTDAKVKRITKAIILGAVIAGLVGFQELLGGPSFDNNLAGFKVIATKMGPYLRLSATFSSANVAAMWFGLALPFAITGLAGAVAGAVKRWVTIVAWLVAIDVLVGAILLTYSRGASLGLAVSVAIMGVATRKRWYLKRRLRQRRLLLLLAAALVPVFGAFVVTSAPVEVLRFSTLSDQSWYKASYSSALPATMKAGQTVPVRVTVENQSPVAWRASGSPADRLSYHWLYSTRQLEQFEGIRTKLPANVGPGGKQTILARVRAPRLPGSYFLIWDMVLGNGTWFSLRTARYQALPVRVVGVGRAKGGHAAVTLPTSADTTRLPVAPPPDRGHIWRVALRMIKTYPFFGTGPQGVRLHYEAFARMPRSISGFQAPSHAHSLYLEILADFGLVGAVLFLAWFVAVWWPLILAVWRGKMVSSWQLALVGAMGVFLGQGLVDYTLQSLSLFILFWLLGGLATTVSFL